MAFPLFLTRPLCYHPFHLLAQTGTADSVAGAGTFRVLGPCVLMPKVPMSLWCPQGISGRWSRFLGGPCAPEKSGQTPRQALSLQAALSAWGPCDLQREGMRVPEVLPAYSGGRWAPNPGPLE